MRRSAGKVFAIPRLPCVKGAVSRRLTEGLFFKALLAAEAMRVNIWCNRYPGVPTGEYGGSRYATH